MATSVDLSAFPSPALSTSRDTFPRFSTGDVKTRVSLTELSTEWQLHSGVLLRHSMIRASDSGTIRIIHKACRVL